MTITIHQPEFLPYIGFFERLRDCDVFVVLDDVGYQKNGFINRNKIKAEGGVKWITVPVLGRSPNKKINEILIDNSKNWQESILDKIRFSYKKSQYFGDYYPFLENALNKKWDKIADLDIYLMVGVNEFLGISPKIIKSSDLEILGNGTERLIKICEELKASEYLSGQGTDKGHSVEKEEFERQRIKVKVKEFSNPKYNQQFSEQGFLPYMSIIDLLFNEGPDSQKILKGK